MKNTTTLILTRHGETEWNREYRAQGSQNSPLTQKGISQAEDTGKKTQGYKKLMRYIQVLLEELMIQQELLHPEEA